MIQKCLRTTLELLMYSELILAIAIVSIQAEDHKWSLQPHAGMLVLQVIFIKSLINIEKFTTYCLDGAKPYVKLTPGHQMSLTVRRILIHGPGIIKLALFPIGPLPEESTETQNNHFLQFRESYLQF